MNNKLLFLAVVLGLCLATTTASNLKKSRQDTTELSDPTLAAMAAPQQPPSDPIADTIARLSWAKNTLQKLDIIGDDINFVFDFLNPAEYVPIESGKGGAIVTASRDTFPPAVGNGLSMSVGYINPCGLVTPHLHPRATEMNYAINGTFTTGFIAENGARTIVNTVYPGQMTIFPKGSIHWLANTGCQKVTFLAAYNDEDPGTTQIAHNLFNLPSDVVTATLGNVDSKSIQTVASGLPDEIAQGLMTCMQKCGLVKNNNNNNYYPPGYPYIPGYPSTGYPSTSYPSTGYPSTSYPSTGYPTTGYPTTGYGY